jgi:hypothetical protein
MIKDITIQELYWAAGFLEGEGCFTKTRSCITVSASQVQFQPLEKLQKLLGGKNYYYESRKPKHSPYYRWVTYGEKAEEIMKALFPLMSPKRQYRISELLSFYAALPGRNYVRTGRTHCKRGHIRNEENSYVDSRRHIICRVCKGEWQVKRRGELATNFNIN